MSTRPDRIEVRMVGPTGWGLRNLLAPASLRPHFWRRVSGANGQTKGGGHQSYATRGSATRAARKEAGGAGLWVHVLDDSDSPRTIRTYPPRGTR